MKALCFKVAEVLFLPLIVALSGCASLSDLENSKKQVETLQKNNAEISKKLEERDKEIEKIKSERDAASRSASENERETARRLSQVRRLQQDVGTVGKCLKGVIQLINASSQENYTGVIVALTKLTEPCEEADKIIQEVESTPTIDPVEPRRDFGRTEVKN